MEFNEDILDRVRKTYKNMKLFVVILAILMITMGIVMFFIPQSAFAVVLWLLVAALLLKGVLGIVIYCKLPREARDGADLGLSIVWTLIALLLVFAGLFSPVVEKIVVGGVIHVLVAVMIGVCCIIGGVKSICFCKQAQLEGKSMAWSIVGGILSIIAGTVVFMYPIGSVLVLTIIYGLFLVISGIALLCRASSF